MYPSEYAYLEGSVSTFDSVSANCRNYPPGNLPAGDSPENYIHCNGTQLKLADSYLGQEQYWSSDYYVWRADRNGKILFIFSTRVSLTTVTLHYYTDNIRGLSRLRFYAVPDSFDVWHVPTISTPTVDVASVQPGREPAGRRNISININFNTKKVLMYKFRELWLEVSEVQFFCSSCKCMNFACMHNQWISLVNSSIQMPPPVL